MPDKVIIIEFRVWSSDSIKNLGKKVFWTTKRKVLITLRRFPSEIPSCINLSARTAFQEMSMHTYHFWFVGKTERTNNTQKRFKVIPSDVSQKGRKHQLHQRWRRYKSNRCLVTEPCMSTTGLLLNFLADGDYEEQLTNFVTRNNKDRRPVLSILDKVTVVFGITLNQIVDVVSIHSTAFSNHSLHSNWYHGWQITLSFWRENLALLSNDRVTMATFSIVENLACRERNFLLVQLRWTYIVA